MFVAVGAGGGAVVATRGGGTVVACAGGEVGASGGAATMVGKGVTVGKIAAATAGLGLALRVGLVAPVGLVTKLAPLVLVARDGEAELLDNKLTTKAVASIAATANTITNSARRPLFIVKPGALSVITEVRTVLASSAGKAAPQVLQNE